MASARGLLSAITQPGSLEERLETLSHALDERLDRLDRACEQHLQALGRTLEDRLDRLDGLLSHGGCAQCRVCRKHAELQEEHSRRLDSLEQLLLGMRDPKQGPPGATKEKRWPPLSREGAARPGTRAGPGPRKDAASRTSAALGAPLREGKGALCPSGVSGNHSSSEQCSAPTAPKQGAEGGGAAVQGAELSPSRTMGESSAPGPRTNRGMALAHSPYSGGREEAEETQLKRDTLQVGTHHTEEPHVHSATYGAPLGSALTDHGPDELRAMPPGAPNPAPETLLGGMVSRATKEGGALRHMSSCPVSVQRIQEPEVVPPLVKTGTASPGGAAAQGQQPQASGIQIRISPPAGGAVVQDRPRSPPRTCCKVIDDDPPGPAPFPHRVVSLRPGRPCDSFSIDTQVVLGGVSDAAGFSHPHQGSAADSGRFGRVHRCTENTSGLKLAAKVMAARSAKEKEMALNEIQVMNQLSHANIIQLYDAFESKNEVVLVMEYLEGGELFERIVDERSPLTEVDVIILLKQICQGIRYMHQMYVLHLDLKPENILCVNRTGHQVKIIDFGLARRYKPREKLRVSFGTPEFLAPEIVNFDFVSFPTDMWTVGVVTYMLLSGLSPFLGNDDSETLNNVLTLNCSFDDEAFEHVSDEAQDFVSNLLIRERSGRLSASQCLKHPWLCNVSEKAKRSNIALKSQVQLKKYMARRLWKKNYIVVAAANRFKKISSCGSLTSLGI